MPITVTHNRPEPNVKQYVIDGPAAGKVIERPASEKAVFLPWERFAEGGVKLPSVIYQPIQVHFLGRRMYVLACFTEFVSFRQLFELFASDLAKEIAL